MEAPSGMVLSVLPPFFHILGGLLLLPIGDGVQGVLAKATAALSLSLVYLSGSYEGGVSLVTCLVGFTTGMLVTLPLVASLQAALFWGECIDSARGMSIGSVLDPTSESLHSQSGQVLSAAMLAVASHQGALLVWLFHLVESAGTPLPTQSIGEYALHVGTIIEEVFLGGAPLVAGVLLVFILVEVSFGLIGKVIPGIQTSYESGVVKWIFVVLIAFSFVSDTTRVLVPLPEKHYESQISPGN